MVGSGRPRGDDAVRVVIATVCAAVLVAPIVVGGDAGSPGAAQGARATPPPAGAPDVAVPARPRPRPARRRPALPPPPAVPAQARRRAARLTLPAAAAQVLLVGFEGTDLQATVFQELRTAAWGGIIVTPENALTLDQVATLAGEARVVATTAGGVAPLAVAEPDGSPRQPALARERPAGVRRSIRRAARRLRGIGVTLVLDPVADVGAAAGPFAGDVFSDDPAVVAVLSRTAVAAWLREGVLPAPGHFPGQGAATQDPLDGPAGVGLTPDQLAARDLQPFRAVLRRAPAVVVSSASFAAYDPITPAALTPAVTRRLLRRTLRFDGVAMTDDAAGLAVATGRSPGRVAVDALRAGIDLVQLPDPALRHRVHAAVLAAVHSKRLPEARLREAAARVLALKERVPAP